MDSYMRSTIVTLAVALVAVLSSTPASAACWWNGYRWECPRYEAREYRHPEEHHWREREHWHGEHRREEWREHHYP
jgi:hypothetical protein